jgi:hypothetical protein
MGATGHTYDGRYCEWCEHGPCRYPTPEPLGTPAKELPCRRHGEGAVYVTVACDPVPTLTCIHCGLPVDNSLVLAESRG